jgi:opacity protein-like surface antigen
MKTWKIAVAVALVMLTAASAFAAGSTNKTSNDTGTPSGSWTFGLQGGASMPTGDYGELASTGWNFGGQADYWMNSQWGFGADIAYHANSATDDVNTALDLVDPGSEMTFSTMQFGVHSTYMIPTQGGTMFPYLQGGAGSYNVKAKIDGGALPAVEDSENKFGFNMGAGVDFRASPTVNLGVNGTYHYISADPSALNWFGVEGRVTFKIPTSSN